MHSDIIRTGEHPLVTAIFKPMMRGTFPQPIKYYWAYCASIFEDKDFIEQVLVSKAHPVMNLLLTFQTSQMRSSQFDVAIVDLCWGECAHAFAATVLGLPVIVYWPNSPGGTNLA